MAVGRGSGLPEQVCELALSVRSFSATISMPLMPPGAWASTVCQRLGPIRPNPFTPTRSVRVAPFPEIATVLCGRGVVRWAGALGNDATGPRAQRPRRYAACMSIAPHTVDGTAAPCVAPSPIARKLQRRAAEVQSNGAPLCDDDLRQARARRPPACRRRSPSLTAGEAHRGAPLGHHLDAHSARSSGSRALDIAPIGRA